MKKDKVLVIAGPTATGKTDLAIDMAKEVDGEIISADSMQIYRHMDIGTAKPALEERQGIPHHMIDIINPDEPYSVAQYKETAENCIKDILARGKVPILAGGTGLYINSVVYNITFSEILTDWAYREEMQKLANEKGNDVLHSELEKVDPESAKRIHPNNVKRVIRALEVYHCSQKPISKHQQESRLEPAAYDYAIFGLYLNREELYRRIELRVDKMAGMGLESEVRTLLEKGYHKELISMQAIGYKEIVLAINNECTLGEAINQIKLGTRHLAKRQMTWFNKLEGLVWLDLTGYDRWAILKIFSDALNSGG